jgi:translation initiation factor IF-3
MEQTVLLIGEDGKKIGNVVFKEAKKIAIEQNKDLMLINKDKRVYKIGDEGKLKYEKKRRERRARAQKRAQKIKEIQVRPTIGDNDLEIKIRRIREFLSDGLKTKLVMKFKKQQMLYKDAGMHKMNEITKRLVEEGLIFTETLQSEGRNIVVFLAPCK